MNNLTDKPSEVVYIPDNLTGTVIVTTSLIEIKYNFNDGKLISVVFEKSKGV